MQETTAYFRSLSGAEYCKWQEQGSIDAHREWTTRQLDYVGYPLTELKNWIDAGRNEWGPHDLMMMVQGSIGEFVLASRNDRFGGTHQDDYGYMKPYRYINQSPIEFRRIEVVYDPRATVSSSPVLTLDEMLKTQNPLVGWIKRFRKSRTTINI